MENEFQPKIFISYSWSSDDMVLALAQRLVSHGVDVVLDKWDLKEGQDKYAFMERCVNDVEITKVLIICDRAYADKANNRKGGVGDETVIISSEVYGNMEQEKFIPIIAEKDENGNPYVPTYIKTRIYIDLSDENRYEDEYEKLLRNIYNKPLNAKPILGKMPEWLEEESVNYFPLADLIKQIKDSKTEIKRKNCISRFKTEYCNVLKSLYKRGVTPEDEFKNFNKTKRIRDYYLDFLQVLAESDDGYSDWIIEFIEDGYNFSTNLNNLVEGKVTLGSESDIDIFKIHWWEVFIFTFVYLRNIKDYKAMNNMLSHTYFLNRNLLGGQTEICNYTEFRHHSHIIEDIYKPTTDKKTCYTLLGDVICNEREKLPIYSKEKIAQADLFLYQVYNAFDLQTDEGRYWNDYWFPTFYVYAKEKGLDWKRMCSKKFCQNMFILFGVNTMEELKEKISRCKNEHDMRYNNSFGCAPTIRDCINPESIGELN
ncbi:MAG: toll/interleukin-1 receptor domain-containing protein [Lachnospiraceae bacterium]|nr:toll/interleukin-1 receptor domain-containing protein [Lachnospiraceae bacterium]